MVKWTKNMAVSFTRETPRDLIVLHRKAFLVMMGKEAVVFIFFCTCCSLQPLSSCTVWMSTRELARRASREKMDRAVATTWHFLRMNSTAKACYILPSVYPVTNTTSLPAPASVIIHVFCLQTEILQKLFLQSWEISLYKK